MFIEPHFRNQRSGWIEIICGSMFSGKTEELIRRLKRAQFAGQKIEVFKPAKDDRYATHRVVSHDENAFKSTPINHSREILNLASDIDLVGIDEAQFFDEGIVRVAQELAVQGIRVLVAGLDMDYRGEPFGPMPDLLAVAEYITKLHAICPHCGALATHSYRKVNVDDRILVGEKDMYEPRCRNCYDMGNILDLKTPGHGPKPPNMPELF